MINFDEGGTFLHKGVSILVCSWNTQCRSFNLGELLLPDDVACAVANTPVPQCTPPVSTPARTSTHRRLRHRLRNLRGTGPDESEKAPGNDKLLAVGNWSQFRKIPNIPPRVREASDSASTSRDSDISGARSCVTDPRLRRRKNEKHTKGRTPVSPQTARRASPISPCREPLLDWIQPGYDVYVICLQESIGSELYTAIHKFLTRVNKTNFHKVWSSKNEIYGLGDGALLWPKATSICGFIADASLSPKGPVSIKSSESSDLSGISGGLGSKGAVSMCIQIWQQDVCFISCHLPATTPTDRGCAREAVLRRLAEAHSKGRTSDISKVFHHIVWAGDFNSRLVNVSTNTAAELLRALDLPMLLRADELRHWKWGQDLKAWEFEEAEIEFIPTYKKNTARGTADLSGADWVSDEYNLLKRDAWYKGGAARPTPPAWCDRVLKWSQFPVKKFLRFRQGAYTSAANAAQSALVTSDHDPISCGLSLYRPTATNGVPKLPVDF